MASPASKHIEHLFKCKGYNLHTFGQPCQNQECSEIMKYQAGDLNDPNMFCIVHDYLSSGSIAFNQKICVRVTYDGDVEIIDIHCQKILFTWSVDKIVNSVSISLNQTIALLLPEYFGIFDFKGNLIHRIQPDSCIYNNIVFSQNGETLMACYSCFVNFWNVETGNLQHTIKLPYSIRAIAYNPNSERIAVCGCFNHRYYAITIIDQKTRNIICEFGNNSKSGISAITFVDSNGIYVAIERISYCDNSNSIEIWNTQTCQKIDTIQNLKSGIHRMVSITNIIAVKIENEIHCWKIILPSTRTKPALRTTYSDDADESEQVHELTDQNQVHELTDQNQVHKSIDQNQVHESIDQNQVHESTDQNQVHELTDQNQVHESIDHDQVHESIDHDQVHESTDHDQVHESIDPIQINDLQMPLPELEIDLSMLE